MSAQLVFEKEIKIISTETTTKGKNVIVEVNGKGFEIEISVNDEKAKSIEELVQFEIENKKMDHLEFYNFIVENLGESELSFNKKNIENDINDKERTKKILSLMDVFSLHIPELEMIGNIQRFNQQVVILPETVKRIRVDFVNDLGLNSFYLKTVFRAIITGKEFLLEYARQWDDRLYVNENGNLREDSIDLLINHINKQPLEKAFTNDPEVFQEKIVEKVRDMIK